MRRSLADGEVDRSTQAAAIAYAEASRRGVRRFGERIALKVLGSGLQRLPIAGRIANAIRRRAIEVSVQFKKSAIPSPVRVLLITHDLSRSGAPRVVFEIAALLASPDFEVTVLSPSSGDFAPDLIEAGATVVIDRHCLQAGSFAAAHLAKAADIALCNTVVTLEALKTSAKQIPVLWYIHEVSLVSRMLADDTSFASTFALASSVLTGSEAAAKLIRPYRPDVKVVPYGLSPAEGKIARDDNTFVQIGLFGSIEPRKGQDLAVAALKLLNQDDRRRVSLKMFGRVLDQPFAASLLQDVAAIPEISYGGELSLDEYKRELTSCDIVLVSSRDDTLPLVSLEALGAGCVLICTTTTGTSSYITSGRDGFVATPDADAIADALSTALNRRHDLGDIGGAARALFQREFSHAAFSKRMKQELTSALSVRTRDTNR